MTTMPPARWHSAPDTRRDDDLRVARTIADLAGDDKVEKVHVDEAINYRMLDRNLWT